ncbi:MAG: DUF6466 family protein [Bifidobacteriaceae bacterium]|jgi:hypothetical protein|nr:DUF6466 family protein [Bifidobacteriaceae bacterium]
MAENRHHIGRIGRIACDVAAVVAALVAIVFGVNAAVSNSFNTTATTLQKNLATYTALVEGKSNATLSSLTDSQAQVDAQLSDAQNTHAVQLPHVRTTIADAVAASKKLDKQIADLKAATSGTTSKDANVNGKSDSSSTSDSDSSKSGSSASDKAKQKKLDALLKQNSQANSSNEDSTSTSPDSSTTKPW